MSISRLYRVPLLGPMLRYLVVLIRLPRYIDAYAAQLEHLSQAHRHHHSALAQQLHQVGHLAESQGETAASIARVHDALNQVSQRVPELEGRVASIQPVLEAHLPQITSVIASQNSFYRSTARELRGAIGRIDTIDRRIDDLVAGIDTARLGTQLEDIRDQLGLHEQSISQAASNAARIEQTIASFGSSSRSLTRDMATLRGELASWVDQLGQRSLETAASAGQLSAIANEVGAIRSLAAASEKKQRELELTLDSLSALASEFDTVRATTAANESKQRELESRLDSVNAVASGFGNRFDELKQAFTTQQPDLGPRISALEQMTGYLDQRTEFVRKEMLFELRYGNTKSGVDQDAKVKLVNEKKVRAAIGSRSVRLNVGCGHISLPDYINVDRRELPGVDVVADATTMPFEPGSVSELFSSHMLEHFPEEALRRQVLPYFRSLLTVGGVLRAVVPDAKAMLQHYIAGSMPFDELREVTFGGQDYDGDFHFTMFTPESMAALLKAAGFKQIEFPALGRKNGMCYEFEVRAQRS